MRARLALFLSARPRQADATLDRPFVPVVDLVTELDGRRTVVDFKTASGSNEQQQVVLSDRLTAYGLAEPEAEQVALGVLVQPSTSRVITADLTLHCEPCIR